MPTQHLYINDPEAYLRHRGDEEFVNSYLLTVTDSDSMATEGWMYICPVELPPFKVTDDELRRCALDKISAAEKRQMAENEKRMQEFEERRQKLLSITHQPSPEDVL